MQAVKMASLRRRLNEGTPAERGQAETTLANYKRRKSEQKKRKAKRRAAEKALLRAQQEPHPSTTINRQIWNKTYRDKTRTVAMARHKAKLEGIAGRQRPEICEICASPSQRPL